MQVDTEIDKLLELSVIGSITKPSTWVNPLVVVPKKDASGVWICVDMQAANVAVVREPHILYTFNKGYHQILLALESHDLTTFASHRGIFRYNRLIFVMSAAAELHQK